MKSTKQCQAESTCQKRVIVCEIYDKDGWLLARESNRCDPEGGTCHRIGVVHAKSNYAVESSCNWTHAEIMAINALDNGAVSVKTHPYRAVISGHDFYCDSCENALRAVGVEVFEVKR